MASLGQARTACWRAKPLTILDLEAPFVSQLARQGKHKFQGPEGGRRARGSILRSGLRPSLRMLPLARRNNHRLDQLQAG